MRVLDAGGVQLMFRYLWPASMIAVNVQQLVHFSGAFPIDGVRVLQVWNWRSNL